MLERPASQAGNAMIDKQKSNREALNRRSAKAGMRILRSLEHRLYLSEFRFVDVTLEAHFFEVLC